MGPTLTSTVGRDKVLKYAQTLTEVGDNRRFDDRAIGTGHQATHSRQLTNLRGGTPCTRVRVHKDRSEEHTSELQSRGHLVCRLLLEKKKKYKTDEGRRSSTR